MGAGWRLPAHRFGAFAAESSVDSLDTCLPVVMH